MKTLRQLIAFLALLGIVGCTMPETASPEVVKSGGSAMELYANASSRTSNDGVYTLWSEGDKMNVFHLVSGGSNYINDGEFVLKSGSKDCFNGTLNAKGNILSATTYDWFAVYPYRASLVSPSGEGCGYVIGSLATDCQTQSGNNSTAHMAGEHMPLVGVVKGVPAEDTPSMAVTNVASMVEVVVRNSSETEIAVKRVSFSVAGCNLVGSFSVDFSKSESVVCTPISGEVADVATLQIEGGENFAPRSQASFYLAVAPFVAKSGSVVTLDVVLQGAEGEKLYSKSQSLIDDLLFVSGKSKRIILNFDTDLNIVELPVGALPPMQDGGSSRIFRTRAMSYNVRNAKGTDDVQDYQRVADAISRGNADVVALQEVDSMTTRNPRDVVKLLGNAVGMYPTFGGAINYGGGRYGVGVLTKEKPLSHYCVPLPCSNEPRVLLVVELENYYFCSTHFSLLAEYREEAARIIYEEAKKLKKPMIVAGDFNALRTATPMLMLAEHFYVFEKYGSQLTFPADSPTKEIDYICLFKDNGAAAVVHESKVLYEPVASDHRPIVIDMTICE